SLNVPGPNAMAIHVIDGLGSSDTASQVGSLNDDAYDPAPKQNSGIIGAAVYRNSKQSYVIASSGGDGAVGATMTYGVPRASASRHTVFDAPSDSSGKSTVTASAQSGRCVVNITAGSGFTGQPLMFSVGTAQGGCVVAEDTNVPPGAAPPGGSVPPFPPGTG